jgi:hypothetical protein
MPQTSTRVSVLKVAKIMVGFVYAVLLVYLVILTLAFFLRLFGANPAADFTDWVYTAAARIMEPFRGIFPTVQVTDRAVFDASLLFAMIMYALFALAVHALINWLASRIARFREEEERDSARATTTPAGPQPQ